MQTEIIVAIIAGVTVIIGAIITGVFAVSSKSKDVQPVNVNINNIIPVVENLHPDLPEADYLEAQKYQEEGDFDTAKRLYKKAVDGYLLSEGPLSYSYAKALNKLGIVQSALGNYNEARISYFKSLSIYSKDLNENKLEISYIYNNLGLLYHDEGGNYEESLRWHTKDLDISKKILGKNHEGIATAYSNIGRVYLEMLNYREAINSFKLSLNIQKTIGEKNTEKIAIIYDNMGETYRRKGDIKRAYKCNEKALQIYTATVGVNHPYIATTYDNRGNILADMNDPISAIEWSFKAYKIVCGHDVEPQKNKYKKNIQEFYEILQKKYPVDYQTPFEVWFGLKNEVLLNNTKLIEQSEKSSVKYKINIFVSYSWKDKELVDSIDRIFSDYNILLKRDIRDLEYKNSIKDFMARIRETDFSIIVLSDSYLKSNNCMYEILEFIKDKNYKEKVLPIILNSAESIFDNTGRFAYIKFWEEKFEDERIQLNFIKPQNSASIINAINRIEEICRNIGEFLEEIIDMKCYVIDNVDCEEVILEIIQYITNNEERLKAK